MAASQDMKEDIGLICRTCDGLLRRLRDGGGKSVFRLGRRRDGGWFLGEAFVWRRGAAAGVADGVSSSRHLTVNSYKACGMTFAGMDQEGAAIDFDQVKPLLRCQRQILDMLYPAISVDAAGDAATMASHKPHQREQHHQKRDNDDDLFERDNRLYRHDKAP